MANLPVAVMANADVKIVKQTLAGCSLPIFSTRQAILFHEKKSTNPSHFARFTKSLFARSGQSRNPVPVFLAV